MEAQHEREKGLEATVLLYTGEEARGEGRKEELVISNIYIYI